VGGLYALKKVTWNGICFLSLVYRTASYYLIILYSIILVKPSA
jgi:hypothetical protein